MTAIALQEEAIRLRSELRNSTIIINALVSRLGGTAHLTSRDLTASASTLETETNADGITITASRSN